MGLCHQGRARLEGMITQDKKVAELGPKDVSVVQTLESRDAGGKLLLRVCRGFFCTSPSPVT